MSLLDKPLHEAFAQHLRPRRKRCSSLYKGRYSVKGAKQSATRLLANASVRVRVEELTAEIAAGTIKLALSDRVQALQDRWDRMRALIAARATDPALALVPGGPTGLLAPLAVRVTGSGRGTHHL